jgi:hypothetical protein
MKMNAQLHEALEAIKPELKDRYSQMYGNIFSRMVEALGPSLKGVYNSPQFARQWGQIRTLVDAVVEPGKPSSAQLYAPKVLNENKVAIAAAQQADFAVAQWIEKIDSKLGDLSDVSVNRFGGCEFVIFGSRHGKRVKIEQSVVVKFSPKGLLFNQFPARIYVDGKFASEAAYKAMFA